MGHTTIVRQIKTDIQEGHDGPESLTRNNCFVERQGQVNFNLPLQL
jgi:hypothetical protein